MMKPLKTYKPYSVIIVPFPFTDSEKAKRRPAIVLSKESYQRSNAHITLLMVTSAKHSRWLGDFEILDLEAAGLTSQSIVRQKVFTIDSRLVLKKIGKLSQNDKQQVIAGCHSHLEL